MQRVFGPVSRLKLQLPVFLRDIYLISTVYGTGIFRNQRHPLRRENHCLI